MYRVSVVLSMYKLPRESSRSLVRSNHGAGAEAPVTKSGAAKARKIVAAQSSTSLCRFLVCLLCIARRVLPLRDQERENSPG